MTVGDTHIVATFPSGNSEAEVALTLNQLLHLHRSVSSAIDGAFGSEAIPCAQVIPLAEQGVG
ncbi:hypothetical protein A0U43_09570 [Citromicrobium sp. RCC1897]|nr:hypothetical protein A0U43_09570 [Citromicrobium sp. RCC1897]